MPSKKNIVLWSILGVVMLYAIEVATRDSILQTYVHEQLSNHGRFEMTYLQFGVGLFGILGNLFYRAFLNKRVSSRSLILLTLSTVFIVEISAGTWVQSFWQFAPLYWVGCFTLGWYYPLINHLVYSSAASELKATVLSLKSMVDSLVQSLVCIVLSTTLTANTHITSYWLIGAVAVLLCICWFILIQKTGTAVEVVAQDRKIQQTSFSATT